MIELKVRLFQKKDSTKLKKLLSEFLTYTRKNCSKSYFIFDNYIDSKKIPYVNLILKYCLNLKNSRLLVAENNHEIIGYIIGFTIPKPNRVLTKAGHIDSFYVSNKYRTKGVGKKLFDELSDWFKKKNCDHLELDVYDGNKKTISLYNKWGFIDCIIKMKKKL